MNTSHSSSTELKQQHPISLYLKIWGGLLFVLSTLSYLVDYFHFEGLLRWGLDLVVHGTQSRAYRQCFHAYAMGTASFGLHHFFTTAGTVGAGGPDG